MILLVVFVFPVKAADNDSLKIKLIQRPFNLNPIYGSNETELKIIKHLFDSLLCYNQRGEIIANLAESWEVNKKADKFLFNLKKDVFFNKFNLENENINNQKRRVTAADWKWSFEYLADPDNKSPYSYLLNKVKGYDNYRQKKAAEIAGIKVIDTYKLEINLERSYYPFIYNLTHQAASVIPKKVVLNKENFSLKPVGTGAFWLSEFSDSRIILKRNNNYWLKNDQPEKMPFFDKLYIFFNTKNLNYRDFNIYQLNQKEYLKLKATDIADTYKLKKIANNQLFFLALNYNSETHNSFLSAKESEILSNYLKIVINEKEFIKKIKNASFLSKKNSDFYTFSAADLSKQDKNSISFGERKFNSLKVKNLNLMANNSELHQETMSLLKNILDDNLEIKINFYNWANYLTKLKEDNKNDMFLMTYNFGNKFDFFYDNFYSTSELNYFNYNNSRIDNLLDYLILSENEKNNIRAYNLIEKILKNDNPYLFNLDSADNYLIDIKLQEIDKLENIYLNKPFNYLKLDLD